MTRAQVWNSWSPGCQATCPNRDIPAVLVRPCIQNALGKNSKLSPSGYSLHRREAAQSCSRTMWRDYIFNPAWSRLGVERAELSEIAVDREEFRVHLGLLRSRLSPKENRARKWVNEHECVGLIEPQFFKVC